MRDDEHFRDNARTCLDHAQNAQTLQQRNHWVGMAQLWLNLAQHLEDGDAQDDALLPGSLRQTGEGESRGDSEAS
jgi:hypothetical protein